MIKYLVIQPCMNWGDSEAHNTGGVISRHRTIKAAWRAIDSATRRLRRQAGMRNSFYDWHIIALEDGSRRRLSAMEQGALADLGLEA